MLKLINHYLERLSLQGLCAPEDAFFICLDDEPYSNREIDKKTLRVFNLMNINTLLIGRPSDPYLSIINQIISRSSGEDAITPADCETRTFFHDIPIIRSDDAVSISAALSKRKAALISDGRIVSYGSVSPEQAYVSFSSVCFSLFVKYFYDNLLLPINMMGNVHALAFNRILSQIRELGHLSLKCIDTPKNSYEAVSCIAEAGKAMVRLGLVDSFFGNISCMVDETIYISQTGSSLDDLEGAIDGIPLNGSSTSGITASSEYSAHRAIYEKTGSRFILHGHPKFSVILSMHCEHTDCRGDVCYQSCSKLRMLDNTPIVSGEIGTGRSGLLNTVPEAIKTGIGCIVYGHGVFTVSAKGFQQALDDMINLENYCIMRYLQTIGLSNTL